MLSAVAAGAELCASHAHALGGGAARVGVGAVAGDSVGGGRLLGARRKRRHLAAAGAVGDGGGGGADVVLQRKGAGRDPPP